MWKGKKIGEGSLKEKLSIFPLTSKILQEEKRKGRDELIPHQEGNNRRCTWLKTLGLLSGILSTQKNDFGWGC